MGAEQNVLMVLANQDFRDEEYSVPREIFEQNGIGTKVAAAEPGDCTGVNGLTISVDFTFDEINVDQFDAIVFVGGLGVERYFANEMVLGLAREFYSAGKYTCAICWAPVILAKAGLIEERNVTAWNGAKSDIENVGARYTGENVTIDGNIVTGSGPDAAGEFGQTIADLLQGN